MQSLDDCALMAAADVIGELTGHEPSEREIIAVAERLRSQVHAGPIYTPPANMNDPNGPIYHRGYYHLYYQLHPFSEGSGPKYWGHVRSRDLASWEPLPIALAPATEAGESEVWSGC